MSRLATKSVNGIASYGNQRYHSNLYSYNRPTISMNVSSVPQASTMVGYSTDPTIFGPSLWFTLHNGAVNYPERPTEKTRSLMKMFITGLPAIVSCDTCREHLYAYILKSDLDEVSSSRNSLFKFFVDLHNYVNLRTGKSSIDVDRAKETYGFYTGKTTVKITYL